jgi:hypothetical protein
MYSAMSLASTPWIVRVVLVIPSSRPGWRDAALDVDVITPPQE